MLKEMNSGRDCNDLILPSFIDKFSVIFNDDEYGYKADDKLLALVMSSLRLVDLLSH